jgi:CubicO group peptidase (beta-lactamase class C family)
MASDLLLQQLGFDVLIVSDAMEMAGVKGAWTGEAAVRAIQAGADMILLPPQTDVAVRSIVRAVREGQLPLSRIDASVLRILAAKERLGLQRVRRTDPAAADRDVARPQDVERALEIARRSVTVVKNDGGLLPLHAEEPLRILHLVLSSDPRSDPSIIQGFPEDELARRAVTAQTMWLGPDLSDATVEKVLARAGEFTHVLASSFARVGAFRGTADMPEAQARLLQRLNAAGRPLIVVSFGSPYLLRQFPDVPVYVCTYGWAESSQRAAISAIFGEHAVGGRLPVTLPGLYSYGHGLDLPRRDMALRAARPEDVGFRPDAMAEVDRIADEGLASKAFPGGVLAVGKDSALVHLRPFGRFSYETDAPPVKADTIYDVASLTKVVATTTMAMILVDEGKLDLRKPVSAFIPSFRGGAKDKVTVENLLTHSSGLEGWAPLYKEAQGKADLVAKAAAMDLAYEPGSKSVYSDLGFILLGEILERVAGEPLDAFVTRRVFEPLGMTATMFCPARDLVSCIPPTERDAWRGRLVHGEVHDENAYAAGGKAPHSGLFSTAGDLARFAQMLLDGGVYDHKRIVSRATIERFTRRSDVPDSARAYGWQTPSPNSSAGDMLSARAFGHTGFTGTSMWIDPERKLFVILLTNRVHPTRENDAIRQVRRQVAEAVVHGLVRP